MTFAENLSRRRLLLGGSAIGGLFLSGMPVFGQGKTSFSKFNGKIPQALYTTTNQGTGVMGPWGEVRTATLDGQIVPYFIQSADKGGVFDFSKRNFFVELGGSGGLTITAEGFAVGKGGKVTPWKGNVPKLIGLIRGNPGWSRSLMQMRSAFATSFAVAATQQKSGKPAQSVKDPFTRVIDDFSDAGQCTTRTVVETVTRTVERTVETITTAQQQWQECYDRALLGPCKVAFFPPAIMACAALACGAVTAFTVIVGVITILAEVTEQIVTEIVECVKPLKGYLPNQWTLPEIPFPDFREPPFIGAIREGIITAVDVAKAIQVLRQNLDGVLEFLGPFKCLLDGEWSLAVMQLGPVGLPFGIDVCLSAACARSLTVGNIASSAVTAWAAALSILATFNSGAAAALATLNIAPIAGLAAAIAGLPPAVLAAGTAIAAMLIVILVHATTLSAQISLHLAINPGTLRDGKLCLHHPTLAAGVITALALGNATVAAIVPPIVTG